MALILLKFWKRGSLAILNLAVFPSSGAQGRGIGLLYVPNHLLGPPSSRPAPE